MSEQPPEPTLSICIPSYNRPESLKALLDSIDAAPDAVDVVICEDFAPRRLDVKRVIEEFRARTRYRVSYYENEKNLGYDRNLRRLIEKSSGRYIMYMGDDDVFTPGALDKFLRFLVVNGGVGYVLRTYQVRHRKGAIELFKYFPKSRRFEPGMATYVLLFRKSVIISGVTFRREYCLNYLTDRFDGTLLFQCYLAAEIALKYPSAYCDVPISTVTQTYRDDLQNFGTSDSERSRFQPGRVTLNNSVNFMKGFFEITRDLDRRYGFDSTSLVRRDLSKYSFPVLSIQRKRGPREFLRYLSMLNREVGINATIHYYCYAAALLLFNEPVCDAAIRIAKRVLGRTPAL